LRKAFTGGSPSTKRLQNTKEKTQNLIQGKVSKDKIVRKRRGAATPQGGEKVAFLKIGIVREKTGEERAEVNLGSTSWGRGLSRASRLTGGEKEEGFSRTQISDKKTKIVGRE